MALPARALDLATVERVSPLSLAGERALPVNPLLTPLFPEGLRRGSIVRCEGPASSSLALSLAAGPSQAGSWVAIAGLPALGAAAAVELGVAMERVVRIAEPPAAQFVTVLAALVDGVDVVLTTGEGVRPGDARRLAARLFAKGGVLVIVGPTGGFSPDIVCSASSPRWQGLGWGTGRLDGRTVEVQTAGRRAVHPRRTEIEL